MSGAPPGGGAFDSGHAETAERAEEALDELGFGEDAKRACACLRPGDIVGGRCEKCGRPVEVAT